MLLICVVKAEGQTQITVDQFLSAGSDTKAISMALEKAGKTSSVVIKFANRTYNIDPSELLAGNKNIILFGVRSNMTLAGGPDTKLELKKGWTSKMILNNFILFGAANSVDNFGMNSLSIDFNGAQNNLKTPSGHNKNAALYLLKCSHITVQNVKVLNNPGQQSLSIGSTDKNGNFLATDIKINGCSFINNTDAFPGNKQNDHSSIYIVADKAIVTKNNFVSGDKISKVATAIEAHTSNSVFSYNTITNYSTGINIVAIVGDQVNSSFDHNTITNVNSAFVFWGNGGHRMAGIKLLNNNITQAYSNDPIIRMSKTMKIYCLGLEIMGNSFTGKGNVNTKSAITGLVGNCIEIGLVKDVLIRDNKFNNINGRAVTLVNQGFKMNRIAILNNTFDNINVGGNPRYNKIIQLKSSGEIDSISIEGNKLNNQQSMDRFIDINRGDMNNAIKVRSYNVKANTVH
jgi:hypothetical protein